MLSIAGCTKIQTCCELRPVQLSPVCHPIHDLVSSLDNCLVWCIASRQVLTTTTTQSLHHGKQCIAHACMHGGPASMPDVCEHLVRPTGRGITAVTSDLSCVVNQLLGFCIVGLHLSKCGCDTGHRETEGTAGSSAR